MSEASFARYGALLRHNRNFRLLWLAQVVSEIGDWFYALAIYALLLELTGSAAVVGAAVTMQLLPQFFVMPAAGVINDRLRRKDVMIASDIFRCVIVLGMMLVRTKAAVWLVYPLLIGETVMAAMFEPARNAVIPNITRNEELLAANTLSATTWSFNLAIGSTLGGVVAALFGRDAVFLANALSFLVSAVLISRMRFEEPHAEGRGPLRARELADFRPVLDGIRYVRSDRRLLPAIFVKGGLGLLGANMVILPLYGQRIFPLTLGGIDPARAAMLGMSGLMGARGLGALIGPFSTAGWAGMRESRLWLGIFLGFLAAAFCYMLLGAAPYFALAALAVVFAHAGGSTIWVFSNTLLQKYTADAFRGRVFAADVGFNTVTVSLGSALAGLAIDWGLPIRATALATGISLLIPGFAWFLARRRFAVDSATPPQPV